MTGGLSRRSRMARASILVAAALVLVGPLSAPAASGLSDSERRGKRIYTEGKGSKHIFVALASGIRAPGTGFACINCHREDGSGTTEGGVRSADITWFTLTKDFQGVRPSGRAHRPYDEASLRRAIAAGKDPGGNTLHDAHPRFTMDAEDLSDLVAYIRVLGREPVPGIADNEVRVGILLPERGPLSGAGTEVRALLSAYFAELNARGGVFLRTLTLVPLPFDPAREGAAAAAARDAVEKDAVFCFLANVGVPLGDEAASLISAAKVPAVVPLVSAPASGYGEDRYTFHIYASLSDQGRVMVDFLAERLPKPASRIGLLYVSDQSGEGGAAGVRDQVRKHSLSVVAEESFPPGMLSPAGVVSRLRKERPDAVAYFGGGREFLALLEDAVRQEWRPVFIAPASMVGGSVVAAPPEMAASIYLASPLTVPDSASKEFAEFLELARKHGIRGEHRSFQLLAYAGAKVLEEGLTRSGRAVTREKFVTSLGALYEYRTGVTPPLTYNENRRVGARGAAILRIDTAGKRLVPAADWAEPR